MNHGPKAAHTSFTELFTSEQHAYGYLGLYGVDSSKYDVIETGVIPSLWQRLDEM